MKSKNRLVFLGTGSATNLERQMTSILFQFGEEAFLIDCGDGAGTARQLLKVGIQPDQISSVFVTHKHRDHILGIPALLFHAVLIGKAENVTVYGPKQAIEIASRFTFETHEYTTEQTGRVKFVALEEQQILRPLKNLDIQVTAQLLVHQHSLATLQCMAYRVDTRSMSVAFGGDMHPDASFDALVKGVDVLIHESLGLGEHEEAIHAGKHSTARDAGIAAEKAGAKLLILTHIAMHDFVPDTKLLAREAKQYFMGEVMVAEDLMGMLLG